MNKNIKTIHLIFVTTLIIVSAGFLYFSSQAEARRGCCSHHGGVCGCRCCDGTSLSAKCAPYYPSCSSKPKPIPIPKFNKVSSTEKETIEKQETSILNDEQSESKSLLTEENKNTTSESDNSIYWLIGASLFGGIVIILLRRRNQT